MALRIVPLAVLTAALLRAPAGSVLADAPVSSAATASQVSFTNYITPSNLPQAAGEPDIAVSKSDNVFLQARTHTLRVQFDDSQTPATAKWVEKSATANVITGDSVLSIDPDTNRLFVSHLLLGCSLLSYSDNEGDSWTGPTGGCAPGLVEDHQSVAAGHYHQPSLPVAGIAYPDEVYYCYQDFTTGAVVGDGLAAYCGTSINGGLSFSPGIPIYTGADCGGLHGHVKIDHQGVAYVPNQGCGVAAVDPTLQRIWYTHQAVVASEDNGTPGSWQVRPIPDSKATPYSDPGLGIGSKDALYFGYQDGGTPPLKGSHPKIAVSHDRGKTWSPSIDVGTPFGLQNVEFPVVVAGDDDRAAFAFLGTTTAGDDQLAAFNAAWHLYVAVTDDGGSSWLVTDATPTAPVQRGCIQLPFTGELVTARSVVGGSPYCGDRNLLDFNGITIDREGRVLVGYADGCTGKCVTSSAPSDNPFSAVGVIARQSCGLGLYAKFDAQLGARCGATAASPSTPRPPVTAGATLPNTLQTGPVGVWVLFGVVMLGIGGLSRARWHT